MFKEHATYFDLFDIEAHEMATYEFELASLDYNVNNPIYLRKAMRMAVMKKAAHERISYPYMKFVESLEREIQRMQHHIQRLEHSYANRRAAAHVLAQRLDAIYNIVVSEDAYRQELRDYKKELLERERIAAEQAKASAAAAHAYAAQQQAYAMQQQAHEMHKQNQLQKEQNHILATQFAVNANNPPPTHVNVYL